MALHQKKWADIVLAPPTLQTFPRPDPLPVQTNSRVHLFLEQGGNGPSIFLQLLAGPDGPTSALNTAPTQARRVQG